MPIIVECFRCRRRLEARDEWAGRRVRCPGCGETLTIAPPAAAKQARAALPVATPIGPPPAQPAGYSAAPSAHPAPRDGLTDLLEVAASAAPAPTVPRRAAKSAPPAKCVPRGKRRRKSGSNKTLFVSIGSLAGIGTLVLCCGGGLILLGPAKDAVREAAIRAKLRSAAARGEPIPAVLAPPPDAKLAEPGAPSGPVWKPESRFADQLATNTVAFDRYYLCLPPGFMAPEPPLKGNLLGATESTWAWGGPPHPNGCHSVCMASVCDFTIPPQRFVGDLEAQLAQLVSQLRKRKVLSELQVAPAERGQIDGKQFIRTRFTGIRYGAPIQGLLLIAFTGDRMLELECTSFAVPGDPDFGLLEAALLTLCER